MVFHLDFFAGRAPSESFASNIQTVAAHPRKFYATVYSGCEKHECKRSSRFRFFIHEGHMDRHRFDRGSARATGVDGCDAQPFFLLSLWRENRWDGRVRAKPRLSAFYGLCVPFSIKFSSFCVCRVLFRMYKRRMMDQLNDRCRSDRLLRHRSVHFMGSRC